MKLSNILFFFALILFTQNINAQELSMFPGFFGAKYYEDDNKISKNDFKALLFKDSEAHELWKKSNRNLGLAYGFLGAEIGFLIWQSIRENNNESQTGPFIGVIATAVAAIGFSISVNKLRQKAVLKYNSGLDSASLKIGATKNGVGLALSF
jgi:hypothetical protein